jgi:hypothetical protein
MSLSREDIRARVLGYGKKSIPVETPFWPDLDGMLAVREMSGEESLAFEKDSENPLVIGRLIVSCLQTRETREQVFALREAEFVMQEVGISALMPVLKKIVEASGLKRKDPNVSQVDEAEKNSEATQTNDSTTN